jgi:hypothetical protein
MKAATSIYPMYVADLVRPLICSSIPSMSHFCHPSWIAVWRTMLEPLVARQSLSAEDAFRLTRSAKSLPGLKN